VPLYDFTTHKRVGISASVQAPKVVFLDGIFTVACKEVRYGSVLWSFFRVEGVFFVCGVPGCNKEVVAVGWHAVTCAIWRCLLSRIWTRV
jgi:uridine kinase